MLMPAPALPDAELDRLLSEVRQTRKLPLGVVWAGEMSDGEVLHVEVDLNGRPHPELCIRRPTLNARDRHWELVRPLVILAAPS